MNGEMVGKVCKKQILYLLERACQYDSRLSNKATLSSTSFWGIIEAENKNGQHPRHVAPAMRRSFRDQHMFITRNHKLYPLKTVIKLAPSTKNRLSNFKSNRTVAFRISHHLVSFSRYLGFQSMQIRCLLTSFTPEY